MSQNYNDNNNKNKAQDPGLRNVWIRARKWNDRVSTSDSNGFPRSFPSLVLTSVYYIYARNIFVTFVTAQPRSTFTYSRGEAKK